MLITLILLEILIRIFAPVSDAPKIVYDSTLGNLYAPNQIGTYVKSFSSKISALYHINGQGWNSPHNYDTYKSSASYRIAVIGDSFVEAMEVDYDKSYPYIIARELNNNTHLKKYVESYSFGHAGASAIHYAYLMDHVAKTYHPDLVIINLVENDYLASLYGYGRKDNWSLKISGNSITEESPKTVSNLYIKKILRHSALARYLTINLDLINKSYIINRLFYAETRNYATSENYASPDELDSKTRQAISFALDKYKETSNKYGFKFLVVLDADRETIYTGKKIANAQSTSAIDIARELIIDKQIPLVDLAPVFYADWSINKNRFDWTTDIHWNENGHQVVAKAVVTWMNHAGIISELAI